jgi:hypothetical protein
LLHPPLRLDLGLAVGLLGFRHRSLEAELPFRVRPALPPQEGTEQHQPADQDPAGRAFQEVEELAHPPACRDEAGEESERTEGGHRAGQHGHQPAGGPEKAGCEPEEFKDAHGQVLLPVA